MPEPEVELQRKVTFRDRMAASTPQRPRSHEMGAKQAIGGLRRTAESIQKVPGLKIAGQKWRHGMDSFLTTPQGSLIAKMAVSSIGKDIEERMNLASFFEMTC